MRGGLQFWPMCQLPCELQVAICVAYGPCGLGMGEHWSGLAAKQAGLILQFVSCGH